MKIMRLLWTLPAALLLAGCLEVEQHPGWIDGQYNGKRDSPPQQVRFGNDKAAWSAAIAKRNRLQNEYGRAMP